MQALLSIASSIIDSGKEQQHDFDYSYDNNTPTSVEDTSFSATSLASSRSKSSSTASSTTSSHNNINTTNTTTTNNNNHSSNNSFLRSLGCIANSVSLSRSGRELGTGLAMILRSFLEFTPPHVQTKRQESMKSNPFRLFCSEAPIAIETFGERLGMYFACSPVCFHVATAYLGRIWDSHPEYFEPLSIFKLMLVALTIAVKFCEDRCSTQAHYAKCGGIEVSELNSLEAIFLTKFINFSAFVKEAELQIACVALDKYCNGNSLLANGISSLSISGDSAVTTAATGPSSARRKPSLIAEVAAVATYQARTNASSVESATAGASNSSVALATDAPTTNTVAGGLKQISHSSF